MSRLRHYFFDEDAELTTEDIFWFSLVGITSVLSIAVIIWSHL